LSTWTQRFPFGIRRLAILSGFFIGCFLATTVLFVILENVDQLSLYEVDMVKSTDRDYSKWAIASGFVGLMFNLTVILMHFQGHSHSHSHGASSVDKDDANTEGKRLF
jgi:Co/Zn/Cd efflux system component